MKWFLVAFALLVSCHKGGLGEDCNPDGTCSFLNLECRPNYSGYFGYRCLVRAQPAQVAVPQSEADIFCQSCLASCGNAGVKSCAFSDPPVWGSKSAVCECHKEAGGPRVDGQPQAFMSEEPEGNREVAIGLTPQIADDACWGFSK